MNLFPHDTPLTPKRRAFTDSDIQSIYVLYPRKACKKAARRAIHAALCDLRKAGESDPIALLKGAVGEYRAAVATWPQADRQFIPHPASWFNAGCWEDDRDGWYKGERKRPKPMEKVLRGWELKLQASKHSVLQAQSGRDRYRAQALWASDVKAIPPRVLEDPAIAAIVADVESIIERDSHGNRWD